MHDLVKKAELVERELEEAVRDAGTIDELESARVRFAGREGILTSLMTEMKSLDSDVKRDVGPVLNKLRAKVLERFKKAREEIALRKADSQNQREKNFDVTAYKTSNRPPGTRHIYSTFIEEMENILISMGFSVFDGPEVDTDFYNFEALNIPEDHPARDMYDTFWIERDELLLRTHTSNTQIHAMQKYGVPIAGIAPGRVYRHEDVDATHDAMFTQCEGVLVDKGINLAHLLGTARTFLRRIFNSEKVDIRMRPGFFPFVEPGVEIDMRCVFCKKGCPFCKYTTWIEIMPGGMLHPNVLRAVNVDPDVYSGFAFGFGVERVAMLRHGIRDIRLFRQGRVKFLQQL